MIANKEEIMILFLSRGCLSVKNVHGKSTDVVSNNLMLHFVRLSYCDEKMNKKKKKKKRKEKRSKKLVTFESAYWRNTSGFLNVRILIIQLTST